MAKAGRPKKGSLGLPKWFDIEKYRLAKSYGAAEWFQQLLFRALLGFYKQAEYSALIKEDPNITIERIKKAKEAETSSGVEQELARLDRSNIIGEMTLNAATSSGVRLMTYGEIKQAYHYHEIEPLFTNDENPVRLNEMEMEKKWLARWNEPYLGNGWDEKDVQYLRVDLSLPAPLLKRDFADYVRTQSKNAKELKGPFFKSQDFSVWYNSGALPYMDLCQWERETGETFRSSDFAEALNAIADKSVGSEDACRKAAKSLAEKLSDIRTIRMLKFQAIKEQDGSRKKSGKLFVK